MITQCKNIIILRITLDAPLHVFVIPLSILKNESIIVILIVIYSRISLGRFRHPLHGYYLVPIPGTVKQIQAPKFGKVYRPGVDAAFHFFKPGFIQAPRTGKFHADWVPDFFLQIIVTDVPVARSSIIPNSKG